MDSNNPSELKAGFLVTVSLGVLLFLLFSASNVQLFQNTRDIPISFDYVGGLEKNAPVHFAGYKVGKVKYVEFLKDKEAQVLVHISLSRDVVLKKDSEAYIEVMGFMGEKFIELTAGSSEAEPLLENEPLKGTDPVPMMAMIKQGTELLTEFEKTVDSLQELTTDLKGIVGENRTELDQIFNNLNQASKNLEEMTHDLKLHPWKLLKKSEGKKKRFLFF
ncbi:MAG: MCE family protein [Candidatus Omnitrophica bacterium]|nr:MCE family protein [Candidatus Omnitrophota bacterium]